MAQAKRVHATSRRQPPTIDAAAVHEELTLAAMRAAGIDPQRSAVFEPATGESSEPGRPEIRTVSVESTRPNRAINLTGPVNLELAERLNEMVTRYVANNKFEPIWIYILSGGGDLDAGLAIYDRLCACPTPVVTVVASTAQSSAATILLAGQRRYAMPSGSILIHECRRKGLADSLLETDLRFTLRCLELQNRRIMRIYCEATGQPPAVVRRWMRKETNFETAEAWRAGLIHGVIKRVPPFLV
ncbi:MAG: ATP-dependent Clp protease proteolytic subunit [Patescibacteria group bacterium]|nr:ATP-dependent Clp protease proteolytic subunit [Patescibacteria group bacterium]